MSRDANRWKEKYLDLIDSHEKLEKNHEDATSSLRRALVQLSLTADGQDADLDQALGSLRSFLRSESVLTGLSKKLSDLEKVYESVEQRRSQQLAQSLEIITKVEGDLQEQELPKDLKNELKAFRKSMRSRFEQLSEYPQLLAEFVTIVEKTLTILSGELTESSEETGLWAKLFGKSKPQPEGEIDAGEGSQNDHKDQMSDLEIAMEEVDADSLQGVSNDLANVIANLIAKLSYPDEQIRKAKEILDKVKGGLEWYDLVPTLEAVADLIISAIGSGQKDFQHFLEALNERLDKLQDLLGDVNEARQEISDDRKQFSQFLKGQVSELKEALQQTDTDSLRKHVMTQVETLIVGMEDFRKKEDERETAMEAQLNNLTERLQAMEQEAREAQEQLLVQQVKANTDNLTRLPNRDALEQRLSHELERMRRYNHPLSLIICDVDFFKKINDGFGHLAGDKVLFLLAKVASSAIRETDFMARYGGEEFVILLPETDKQSAAKVAEKIREKVESSPFHFKNKRVSVTMSFGVSEYKVETSTEKTFSEADKALYKAKDSGRNQVQIAE